MPLCAEVDNVLGIIDKVQSRVSVGRQEPNFDGRLLSQVNNDINTLLSVLKNPVFRRICKIQDTVNELGNTLARHPSVTSNDFDITPEGNLILKITPPTERFRPPFDTTPLPPIPSSKASHTSKSSEDALLPTPITTPTYAQEFERVIQRASQGRVLHSIRLFKTEGSSLGFSVVGLKSQEKGELGIFVQEIQPNGIAARDGSLRISDQILAIDGQPLDSAITHQQAIGILQQTRGEVEIVVARAPETSFPVQPFSSGELSGAGQQPPKPGGERPTPPSEDTKATEMVLSTEWAEVEVVHLINDGTGLGFGIIGGRSTGVVVKTILPGGVADRSGQLRSGDHILQIGDVNLVGMGSEQVAAVLRQCGNCVRLVVARPVEPSSPDLINSPIPIVPTRILGDPEELTRHLMQANGYANHFQDGSFDNERFHGMVDDGSGTTSATFDTLPEVEIVDVELKKDSHGLGITIAGYVCEKEELSGIFIKSISEGSAADISGRIAINDRIVEVDGQTLQGYTNHQAVEVLRKTSHVVSLKLERYHHGSKYEQLQSAISHSEHKPPTPSSVSALSLPQVPVDSDGEGEDILEAGLYDENEEQEQTVETHNAEMDLEDLEMLIDTRYEGEILTTVEAAIMAKWSKIMGPDNGDIVVAQLSKAKNGGGLGISLEGTVDVEDGREVRPHHYIRSILPDGPVGRSHKLLSGDELLEVNGRRLLGLNHVEVVGILKDLPMSVRIVCARRPGQPSRPIDTSQDRSAFAARSILGGSLQNLFQGSDRMVKAKSDGSLASTGTTGATDTSLSKIKSRSLEPLSGLAMWSLEPHIIELPKGDRGLGFSILDYQDPMNPTETVIVIRSLVPGGVAQQDQRLIPGDRLLAVNDINLENASLDQAVQALKGAPKGVVRIVVAKPLPLPDTSTLSPTQSLEDTPPPPLPVSPPPEQFRIKADERVDKPKREEHGLDQIQMNSMIVPVATERLITTKRNEPSDVPRISSITPLPTALERTIKVQKNDEQLGVNVEVVEDGINGIVVTALAKTGAISNDGRIHVGDYIIAINNEGLRNTTNAQARAILRRAQLFSKELSVSYIPVVDAEVHKATYLIQQSLAESENITPGNKLERSTSRTPADGEETGGEVVLTTIPKIGSRNEKQLFQPTNVAPSTSMIKSSQLKHNETTTLYINPDRGNSSITVGSNETRYTAQPQIQKRVVTHVTIFPSPPPDVTQDTVTKITTVTSPIPVSDEAKIVKDDSVDEDSSKRELSAGHESLPKKAIVGDDGALLLAKHWGPERLVELQKEPNKSLGISIVGGKVDLYNAGHEAGSGSTSAISGIFIKNVLLNSPAGRTGQLKTGDRILAVDSIDLRSASHEKAVEVIRAAGNPVKFLVQSLVQWSDAVGISTEDSETSKSEDTDTVTKSQSQAQYSGSQSQSTTTTSSQSKSGTEASATSTSSTSRTQTKNDAGSSSSSSTSTESEKVTQKRDGASVEESEENEEFEDDPFLRAEDEIKKSPVPKPSGSPSSHKLEPAPDERKDEKEIEAEVREQVPIFKPKIESESSEQHSSEEADELGCEQPIQGKTRTKAGTEIDRASAGNVRLTKGAIINGLDEDSFGYTQAKIEKRWGELAKISEDGGHPAKIIVEDLDRGSQGLGISLAGHKDRLKMAVFVVGLNPEGLAHKTKTLKVGDEILEVNGNVLHGRSHLNASALIKSLPHGHVKIIALRKSNALNDLSVKPIVQFPVLLDQEKPEEKYSVSKFPGLRLVTLKKTDGGLGIMIMEGKHAELGRGIFVSDIQESSIAEQAGLLVGDLILSVNQEDLLGCDYDHAASILKKTEGSVTLVVCNASKTPEKGEDRTLDLPRLDDGRTGKPGLLPKPSKIPSPSKLTSILSTLRKSTSPTEPLSTLSIITNVSSSQNIVPTIVSKQATSPIMLPVTMPLSTSPATSVSKMNISPRNYETGGDPATCVIQPGKDTTIEINKDKMGLGMSIVGGIDTLINTGSIIIHEVYPDGAVYRDGRLRPGDVLLRVNNEDFTNITHIKALAALRQTPTRVKMTVLRDESMNKEDEIYDIQEIELVKKLGKGLGLSIVGRKNGSGVFISDVVPSGTAEADGRLMKGDQILMVNGSDLKNATQEEAASVLKTALGSIHMKIGRLKVAGNKRYSEPSTIGISPETTPTGDIKNDETDMYESDEGNSTEEITSETGSPHQIRTVILERGNEGLGFSIVGGFGSPHGNLPIYVKTVFDKGAACNKLKRGDQILAVNKFQLDGLTHQEVVTILKQTKENVTLSILS